MAMPRRFVRRDNWEYGGQPAPAEGTSGEPRSRKRRLATTLVFTTLFFAGASLAAVAGDRLAGPLESAGGAGDPPGAAGAEPTAHRTVDADGTGTAGGTAGATTTATADAA